MAPQQDTVATATGSRLDNAEAGLTQAMDEVATRLDAPGLATGERMQLLQRQAELGDLRDDLAVRRRRLGRPMT
jgi:hypothetical protein